MRHILQMTLLPSKLDQKHILAEVTDMRQQQQYIQSVFARKRITPENQVPGNHLMFC